MAESNQPQPGDDGLTFVVERLRLSAYAGFWVIVVVGIMLTKYVSKLDLSGTLLNEVFGYNNICVYFDFPPSNQLLPFLWSITLALFLAYLVAQVLQMKAELSQGLLSRKVYKRLLTMKWFEATTFLCFSTCFAVSPDLEWNSQLYIHTIPFFFLQIGLVSLAVSNTMHGMSSGYWQRLEMPSWFTTAAFVYCGLFAIVVAFKIPFTTNAMLHYRWWPRHDTITLIARVFDVLFLLLAAVIPMAKAAYLSYFKADKVDVIRLAVSTAR